MTRQNELDRHWDTIKRLNAADTTASESITALRRAHVLISDASIWGADHAERAATISKELLALIGELHADRVAAKHGRDQAVSALQAAYNATETVRGDIEVVVHPPNR